jgi:hypothetical protein
MLTPTQKKIYSLTMLLFIIFSRNSKKPVKNLKQTGLTTSRTNISNFFQVKEPT